jgi:hypothetical protein
VEEGNQLRAEAGQLKIDVSEICRTIDGSARAAAGEPAVALSAADLAADLDLRASSTNWLALRFLTRFARASRLYRSTSSYRLVLPTSRLFQPSTTVQDDAMELVQFHSASQISRAVVTSARRCTTYRTAPTTRDESTL